MVPVLSILHKKQKQVTELNQNTLQRYMVGHFEVSRLAITCGFLLFAIMDNHTFTERVEDDIERILDGEAAQVARV